MVGGLVEQQQVGPLVNQQRQHQARFLTARKRTARHQRLFAGKAEAAEMVAQVLLTRLRIEPHEVLERRLIGAQLLYLVLGEIAQREIARRFNHLYGREPGFEDKETIATGTRAAARGGFTTVCCMPISACR